VPRDRSPRDVLVTHSSGINALLAPAEPARVETIPRRAG
jgi:hypothetical protein